MELRDLSRVDEFRQVVELEKQIWGFEAAGDVVSVPMLVATMKRGAILIGAHAPSGELVGFVYSFPGIKDGKTMQWSHMLGVRAESRQRGLGRQLKIAQRQRTLDLGLDLIEWTYDPLQAANAHFNVAGLGVVVGHYVEDAYGESASHLHRGAPTDRFVAEWRLNSRRVVHRLAPDRVPDAAPPADALLVVRRRPGGERGFTEPDPCAPIPGTGQPILVWIPGDFTRMLAEAPGTAREWRRVTRRTFTDAFGRGYWVTDFFLDPATGSGRYLLRACGDPDAPGAAP